MKNITSKIRNARNSKGFSQEYMAETLGISQRQYGRLENGESQMNLQYLEKISNELDIRLEDLFTNEITQENHNQSGGLANSGHIIVNEFSEKLIEQYERRLIEKNDQISLLKEQLVFMKEQLKR